MSSRCWWDLPPPSHIWGKPLGFTCTNKEDGHCCPSPSLCIVVLALSGPHVNLGVVILGVLTPQERRQEPFFWSHLSVSTHSTSWGIGLSLE